MSAVSVVVIVLAIFLLYRCATHTTKKRVWWFYRPDCGYCRRMEPQWRAIEATSTALLWPFETRKIDINDPANQSLAEAFDVNAVPFIVKLDADGVRNVYGGDRSYGDLLEWIRND